MLPVCCLPPDGQPKRADARADAAARGAVQVLARPAEPLGAALHDVRVAAGDLARDAADVEDPLDAAEVRVELVGAPQAPARRAARAGVR